MPIQIPSRYIPTLNLVRNLHASAVSELVSALESSTISSYPEEMTDRIASSVPNIQREQLEKIVELLYTLYHVREASEVNRNTFLRELVESIREQATPKISEEELSRIQKRFKHLLSIKTLESISKAIGLQRDEERLYCSAKILSDIRPVFGEDVKSRPVAATITHSLKISYHENGDHKNFYVVLDEFDLDALEKIIKRAKLKADTLSAVLSDSGIPRLGM